MKAGDLVNFETSAWVFESAKQDYANPGVILQVANNPMNNDQYIAEVYWADGRITKEYDCYLQPAGATYGKD